jgi:hypothetical protein
MKKSFILTGIFVAFFAPEIGATITVVNGMSHEYTVIGNQVYEGQIVIKNLSKNPARVVFYKTDLQHNCDGETKFIKGNSQQRSCLDWIEYSNNEIMIAAEKEVTVVYSIKVPDNKYEGSYWGVIMVEELEGIDTSDKKKGIKVRSNVRYAVQVIANFNQNVIKDLNYGTIGMDTLDGEQYLTINIENSGNTLLKPVLVLELYNNSGETVKRIEVNVQKVYPGNCKKFLVPLLGVPIGKFTGVLVADCGDNNIFGLNLNLDLTGKRG